MTNYERLKNEPLEDMARDRTKCVNYSFGYTYKNDVGVFEPKYMGDNPYIEAIMAEVEWLNRDSENNERR